jgi:hypothetical protein
MLSAKLATKAKTAAAITVAAANRIDVFELPRVIPMKTITRHNMYTLGHQVALIPPELCRGEIVAPTMTLKTKPRLATSHSIRIPATLAARISGLASPSRHSSPVEARTRM